MASARATVTLFWAMGFPLSLAMAADASRLTITAHVERSHGV